MRTVGSNKRDTAAQILDVAERLVQTRGFNAVSYAAVAADLKITTAALHYHFPGKAELGAALIERYAFRFFAALGALDAQAGDSGQKVSGYVALYADVLSEKRMCLCGMLAAEFETLPPAMQHAVIAFFDRNEAWLAGVLEEGRAHEALQFGGTALDEAQSIISALEGAMLIARSRDDLGRFQQAADRLLVGLRAIPTATS